MNTQIGCDKVYRRKVALCGVPGMKKSDIVKMEDCIKEEYEDVAFTYLSENVLKKEQLIERCKDMDVLISWDQEMDDEIYEKLNLRAYCAASIGYNGANVQAATRNNVLVTNVSGYCIDEVATHAIMLILSCYRKLYSMVPYVKQGNWDLDVLGSIKKFEDSTIGLLGFGDISRAMVEKLSGFGVTVLAYDPFVSEEGMASFNVTKVDLDTLLKASDYLSVHAPLLDSTKNIINMESIKKMKKTAYIINTARGGLINHKDLFEALSNHYIQGAGLDVIGNEPPKEIDEKIIHLPNTIVTGHSAYVSDEASDLQIRTTAKIVGSILKSEMPTNIINPEVMERIDWIEGKTIL